jgi:hypothetical protein
VTIAAVSVLLVLDVVFDLMLDRVNAVAHDHSP